MILLKNYQMQKYTFSTIAQPINQFWVSLYNKTSCLMNSHIKIAVVIPAYKVCNHILNVVNQIGPEICRIYIIDDACPDGSGRFVESHCHDDRIIVIRNSKNRGVGGAVMVGYKAAIEDDIDIIVKLDGDGQMDPGLIPNFVAPIINGKADYTKGNRFYKIEELHSMPKIRLIGNAALSFMTKLSSGYWDLFDPTNGYTAIHRDVAQHLPLKKISCRYFFETDILFRLNTLRAVVIDIPMDAKYGNEVSNLKISKIAFEFFIKHLCNFSKRIFYNFYLRDMSLASIELPIGIVMFLFGSFFGAYKWIESINLERFASAGTVMLSALPVVIGLQLILAFLGQDIRSVPREPFHQFKRNTKITFNPLK